MRRILLAGLCWLSSYIIAAPTPQSLLSVSDVFSTDSSWHSATPSNDGHLILDIDGAALATEKTTFLGGTFVFRDHWSIHGACTAHHLNKAISLANSSAGAGPHTEQGFEVHAGDSKRLKISAKALYQLANAAGVTNLNAIECITLHSLQFNPSISSDPFLVSLGPLHCDASGCIAVDTKHPNISLVAIQ